MKVEGSCHCGAITFEAEVTPGTISVCHCTDCQMLTGAAFRANIRAAAEGFRLLTGTPREYVKVAASGTRRVQAFCGTCGASVYACDAENPTTYNLRVGTLRQRDDLGRPAREIWTHSRLNWVEHLDGVAEFDGPPK